MPRPLKLDDQKKQRVIHLVMHGATVAGAAREVGCSVRTVEREADRDEPFGWRLDVARDSRDAADQPQEEADEADAVTVDLLFEGFCLSLTDELALLWPSEPHGSGQAVPCSKGSAIPRSAGHSCERCDKTVTSAPPTA